MNYRIQKTERLSGTVKIPPSKSQTMRAILLASLAEGESTIQNPLTSPDTDKMIKACRQMGATIGWNQTALHIKGVSGRPFLKKNVMDAGNSGQVMRFATALCMLQDSPVSMTGDESIRFRRPIQPLCEGLSGLGVVCKESHSKDAAQIVFQGPARAGHTTLCGKDSQPVSALLLLASLLEGKTHIQVRNPGEHPWIDVTLSWLSRLGVLYQQKGYEDYWVEGRSAWKGFAYTVPGDFSSMAYPVAAALVTGSELCVTGVDWHDAQGDKYLFQCLESMGASFRRTEDGLEVLKSHRLESQTLDLNQCIDALPVLAVLGCFFKGEMCLKNTEVTAKKESNRVQVMYESLKKMGADISLHSNELRVRKSTLQGAMLSSFEDHRIAMALSMAGLGALGETCIESVACVNKSYPRFLDSMQALGAHITCA